jgi:hypothetical protein
LTSKNGGAREARTSEGKGQNTGEREVRFRWAHRVASLEKLESNLRGDGVNCESLMTRRIRNRQLRGVVYVARHVADHIEFDFQEKKKYSNVATGNWQSRPAGKRSNPLANPLPSGTGRGMAKGTDSSHRTLTRVTCDRHTAVSRQPVAFPTLSPDDMGKLEF